MDTKVDHSVLDIIDKMYFSVPIDRSPYSPDLYREIGPADLERSVGSKPTGGLWLSPILDPEISGDSTWWEYYSACISSGERDTFLRHQVTLNRDAKMFCVDSLDDLVHLSRKFPFDVAGLFPGIDLPLDVLSSLGTYAPIDWPSVGQNYDMVYLTENGLNQTQRPGRSGDPMLSGWSVVSLLILNPEALSSVSDPIEIKLNSID